MIMLYKPSSKAASIDALRMELMYHVTEPEKRPPTQDVSKQHILRCLLQVKKWLKASTQFPELLSLKSVDGN